MVWWTQCGQKKLKITIYDVTKIHNSDGVGFGPIFFTHTFDVNAYFGPSITNLNFPTPKYGIENTNYNMEPYRESFWFTENLAITRPKLELVGLEAVSSTRKLNQKIMKILALKTYDKLLCKSNIVDMETRKLSSKTKKLTNLKKLILHHQLDSVIIFMKIDVT